MVIIRSLIRMGRITIKRRNANLIIMEVTRRSISLTIEVNNSMVMFSMVIIISMGIRVIEQ